MINIVCSRIRFASVVLALLLGMATLAQAGSYKELPLTITSLDVSANSVTLEGLEMVSVEYRLAFDVEIKLLGGDPGTANNLRVGDSVTAVVDAEAGVVYKLFVVGRAS